MNVPCSYHTHTLFCDGKNSPREMVEEAIRLGCPEIGFSGHSRTAFDETWCMTAEGTERYRAEVLALREQYAGKIRILLGVEQDFWSEEATDGYDYVIGSVHYVRKNGKYLPVDESAELQKKIVREEYRGDFYAFAEDYFRSVGDVYRRTGCRIVGHFDLITKFNEGDRLFDTQHPRYAAAATEALEKLLAAPVVFEINTGAMARGYRSEPYPAPWIRERIAAAGRPLIWTSDCHDKAKLLFGMESAPAVLLRELG